MDAIQNTIHLCHHTVKSVDYGSETHGTHKECDVPVLEKEALVSGESAHLSRSRYTRVRRFYRQLEAQWLGRYTFPHDPSR